MVIEASTVRVTLIDSDEVAARISSFLPQIVEPGSFASARSPLPCGQISAVGTT
jgi:hypothetical protein